jgi:hypothetical protein
MSDYLPLWNIFGLGHPAPVVGARFVSPALPEDSAHPFTGVAKAVKPVEMRCVFFSAFKNAYYVRVRHNGKKVQRSFFSTPEEAMAARDELERQLGKVA